MIQFKKILLPIDFSEHSKYATEYACEFSRKFGASLHLLHVVEPPVLLMPSPGAPLPESLVVEQEESAASELQRWLSSEPRRDYEIRQHVVRGTAFVEIVRFAKQEDVELIVMATHGRSGLNHLLIGSVAERVVRKSPCPVLTVRPQGQQFVMP